MTLYPSGYNTTMRDIDTLFRTHHVDKMHPEFARRLRNWLIANQGRIGIGGSWRAEQPAKPGFAPEGKSFHQSQTFRGGRVAFAAVDLVHVNGTGKHRSPNWVEVPRKGTPEAKQWGLHCNVKNEPWHIQPIELDGYGGWLGKGRPELVANYQIPAIADVPVVPPVVEPELQPGPATVFAYPGFPIRLGSKGIPVQLIQAEVGAKPDGDFGPATERRVKAWQKARGLLDDGVVGRVTWKKMFG